MDTETKIHVYKGDHRYPERLGQFIGTYSGYLTELRNALPEFKIVTEKVFCGQVFVSVWKD